MERQQSAKFISSGSLMIGVFYVFLAIFSRGLRDTSIPGISPIQLLYIPLIIAFAGIAFASYNLGFDSDEPWDRGKIIAIFIAISIIILTLAQISLIIAGVDEQGNIIRPVFFYIGDILMITSNLFFGITFYIFRKQLLSLYFKKIIIKYPNIMIIITFSLQFLAYCLFFGASFTQLIAQNSIDLVGIVISSISILLLIGGLIPINISFRTYSHLVEDESLRN